MREWIREWIYVPILAKQRIQPMCECVSWEDPTSGGAGEKRGCDGKGECSEHALNLAQAAVYKVAIAQATERRCIRSQLPFFII